MLILKVNHHEGEPWLFSCKGNAIMIAEHNETKVYGIMFLPEVHEEQVKIVAKNKCLVIGILKQSEN